MKENVLRIIFLVLILVISSIIFGFSSQDGETSGGISKAVITKIADIINIKSENRDIFIEKGEGVIRKLAHFAIYTLLGIFSMAFFVTFNMKRKKQVLITSIWGFLYACTDEMHQMFTNGRNASFLDVLLDTSGVIFGILVVIFIIFISKKVNNRSTCKNKINIEKIEKIEN